MPSGPAQVPVCPAIAAAGWRPERKASPLAGLIHEASRLTRMPAMFYLLRQASKRNVRGAASRPPHVALLSMYLDRGLGQLKKTPAKLIIVSLCLANAMAGNTALSAMKPRSNSRRISENNRLLIFPLLLFMYYLGSRGSTVHNQIPVNFDLRQRIARMPCRSKNQKRRLSVALPDVR